MYVIDMAYMTHTVRIYMSHRNDVEYVIYMADVTYTIHVTYVTHMTDTTYTIDVTYVTNMNDTTYTIYVIRLT